MKNNKIKSSNKISEMKYLTVKTRILLEIIIKNKSSQATNLLSSSI